MALISAHDLGVRLGRQTVLHGVNLSLEPGEVVTIVGPNGSGKSTFLRALIGALRPSAGRVSRAPGLRIGYVPQRLHIDPTLPLTVARFLDLPTRRGTGTHRAALERVGAAGLEQRALADLSGGQLQRVSLARALLVRPQALILDEPTQGLDHQGSADFYALIDTLRREEGCAVLMVSHELHVVMSASDRVICLNGHICCEGTPEVVSSAPEYRALFGRHTHGALALYRHHHDHSHDSPAAEPGHAHDAPHDRAHDHGHDQAHDHAKGDA